MIPCFLPESRKEELLLWNNGILLRKENYLEFSSYLENTQQRSPEILLLNCSAQRFDFGLGLFGDY